MGSNLFYFIGNSDIAIDGETRKLKDFRKETNELLKKLKEKEKKGIYGGWRILNPEQEIQLPIFCQVMEYLKNKIDTVYLIFTNQPSYHEQDTIYAKEIIKMYCNERYKDKEIKEIEINKNPSDWDEMAEFFRDYIKKNEKEIKNAFENYITVATGTPASYTSLALNLTRYSTKFIYAERKEGSVFPVIKEIKLFSRLQKEHTGEIILSLINSYQYFSAEKILPKTNLRNMNDLQKLLKGLNMVLNDNFENGFNILQKELPEEIKERIRDIRKFVYDISHNNEFKKLLDLYYKLEIKKETGEYVEFVSLLFNIRENISKFLLEGKLGITLKKEKNEFKEFNEYIEKNEELKKELEKENIKWKNKPNHIVIMKIFKFSEFKDDPSIKSYEEYCQFLEKGIKINDEEITLQELRHKGRYAHGVKGVDKEILEKFSWEKHKGIDGILEKVRETIKEIFNKRELEENIYTKANNIISKIIEDEIKK